MTTRVQVLLEEDEKELFQRQARKEGVSLSAWFREAGKERLKSRPGRLEIETRDDLRAFFSACDTREEGREPDWQEHLETLERSKRSGAAEA
jgi:hypothetical protein